MKTWALIREALETHGTCAMISVLRAEGSAPREAGSRMVLTPDGFHGTIGGGALEWRALAAAQGILGKGSALARATHSLGPDLGQCCGGRVEILTEVFDRGDLSEVARLATLEAEGPFTVASRIAAGRVERTGSGDEPGSFTEAFGDDPRRLYLFGAGHVGRALVLALAPLPFALTWIDSRRNAFPGAMPANAAAVMSADPPAELAAAPPGSFVLVMTHSHALDLAIVEKAMRLGHFPYVGLIGSETKRARFVRRLVEAGLPLDTLVCPIGAGLSSKVPAVIAASTAVELLKQDEVLRTAATPVTRPAPPARIARRRGSPA